MGSSLREALLPSRAFRRQPPGVMCIWQLRSHGTDIDCKGRCPATNDLLELSLPTLACLQIILVEPDLQSSFARFGCSLKALLEPARSLGVRASVAQKHEGRACEQPGHC